MFKAFQEAAPFILASGTLITHEIVLAWSQLGSVARILVPLIERDVPVWACSHSAVLAIKTVYDINNGVH